MNTIANILASTDLGTMIVNRFDYNHRDDIGWYGVGYRVLNDSVFEQDVIETINDLLLEQRDCYGDGVVALDCGANIGTHTIAWAKHMNGWGKVIAFEAQERVFYSLAGNIAINNCFNARAIWSALGAEQGSILVPQPDYCKPSSFGSLEIQQRDTNEFIGQKIDFSETNMQSVPMITIDSLNLDRVDFIKIDVEGMEVDVLKGGMATIDRDNPILLIENIKSDNTELLSLLKNYHISELDINYLAIPRSNPRV